jgi:hypothetical protein
MMNNPGAMQQQQQQPNQPQQVNMGMMQPNPVMIQQTGQQNQMINPNQMNDQKDLRHLLIAPTQQTVIGLNQQPQQVQQQTSQNWINVQQVGGMQQPQQAQMQQQQIYMNNQGGMVQQQQQPKQPQQPQQQNYQYYQ